MRRWALWIGTLEVLYTFPGPAFCQTSAQMQKERALGDGIAKAIERQAERIRDQTIIEYLQRIENRLALAAGVKPLELRLTRNPKLSAFVLPNGVLYLSSGLLDQMKSEAELAGLLAHEMAHGPWQTVSPNQTSATIPLYVPPCVLSAQTVWPAGWTKERREPERQATATAVKTLQAAGYDPEALLELLSKLSYNHPVWSKTIVSDDLLDLRATVENEVPPAAGYLIDGSEFLQMRATLATIVGPEPRRTPPPSLTK